MRRRFTMASVLALLLAMAAVPALAGGWAEAALDAGSDGGDGTGPTVIGFTLLQHGVTPVDWGSASVVAVNEALGETVHADAVSDGGSHWTAQLRLPAAGEWTLTIRHSDLEVTSATPMTLAVGEGAPAGAQAGAAAEQPVNLGLVAVLIGMAALPVIGGAVVLVAIARRRRGMLPATD